jgi:hypothetical protein
VDPSFSALFEPKVFHYVRDVDLGTVQASLLNGAIQQFSGRSNEWVALAVLFIAGLFSDEHDTRGGDTFSEDCLSGVDI